MFDFDKKYFLKNNTIAGIDEAGRGPLAGPVVAASVVFDKDIRIEGVNDSKKISAKKREILYDKILLKALHVGVGIVYPDEIDEINILNATKKAMKLSIIDLKIKPDLILVDGNQIEFSEYNQENIIKGDSKSFSIASASIIAKVTRDRMMEDYDKILPEYQFSNHKGYGTKKHFESIVKYKASIIHRKSFNPISKYLPSFNYYIKNNILDQLLVQIAGEYLIRNSHQILNVKELSINSAKEQSEFISYIDSNIEKTTYNKPKILEKNYKYQTINIIFNNGTHKISIDSI